MPIAINYQSEWFKLWKKWVGFNLVPPEGASDSIELHFMVNHRKSVIQNDSFSFKISTDNDFNKSNIELYNINGYRFSKWNYWYQILPPGAHKTSQNTYLMKWVSVNDAYKCWETSKLLNVYLDSF